MDTEIFTIIHKHFTGNPSLREARALQRWVRASDKNSLLFKECEKFYRADIHLNNNVFDPESSWLSMKAKMQEQEFAHKERTLFPGAAAFRKIAAAVLLCAVAGAFLYTRQHNGTLTRYMNGSQEVLLVKLPDSSKIWVRPNGAVSWQRGLLSARQVRLEGEAYFEIAADPQKPFIVTTGATETRVLGTAFNLVAFPDSDSVELSVLTGSVRFSRLDHPAGQTLAAGQRAVSYNATQSVSGVTDMHEHVLAWKTRTLRFHEKPLRDVVSAFKRYYHTKIIYPETLGSCKFTGTLRNLSLPQALESISLSLGMRVNRIGSVWTLSGDPCTP